MNSNPKIFFYRYWWSYYIFFFLLVGIIIFVMLHLCQSSNVNKSLANIADRLDSCNCNKQVVIVSPPENPIPPVKDTPQRRPPITRPQNGCLSFTLDWNTIDDLDLNVIDPDGNEIFFKKFCKNDGLFSSAGGQLDVDMNAPTAIKVTNPIENVFFKCSTSTPKNGNYSVKVIAYNKTTRPPVSFHLKVKENGIVKKEFQESLFKTGDKKLIVVYRYNKNEN